MISLSVLFALISACACLLLPAALVLTAVIKYKASWKAAALGAAVFAVFQLFTRIPILQALSGSPGFILFSQTNALLYALLLALSAGVFEEAGRYAGMRIFMPRSLTWINGVAFGLGHGGLEAFVLVGLPYALSVLPALLSGDPAYTGVQPALYLLAGAERMMTIAVHIGLTMLVLYAVRSGRLRCLALAVGLHAAVDFGALLLSGNVWAVEILVAAAAALFILLTWKFKNKIEACEPRAIRRTEQ